MAENAKRAKSDLYNLKQGNQRWQIPPPATYRVPVLGNVHPIKIENFNIIRDVISLLAQIYIFLIDRATQEVPINKYLKEIVGPVFEIYIRH